MSELPTSLEPSTPLAELVALDGGPTRHDGWTPDRMAAFCEALAECGIVRDACVRVGMGVTQAYAARRRVPLFAAAWEDALSHARDQLADALLERALTGSTESFFRDGILVGERRTLDNKLAIALLRRLDLREAAARAELIGASRLARNSRSLDGRAELQPLLQALRSGDEGDLARVAALLQGRLDPAEANKANDPNSAHDDPPSSPSDRIWFDSAQFAWFTNFAPPPGFDGARSGSPLDPNFQRECSAEETSLLERWRLEQLVPLEAEREVFFDDLKGQLIH